MPTYQLVKQAIDDSEQIIDTNMMKDEYHKIAAPKDYKKQ